jgi:hypothetical protein
LSSSSGQSFQFHIYVYMIKYVMVKETVLDFDGFIRFQHPLSKKKKKNVFRMPSLSVFMYICSHVWGTHDKSYGF